MTAYVKICGSALLSLNSMFKMTGTLAVHCPLFSKCLPICEVSARSNMKEGEKKLNKSNLITNTQAAVNFNLGRESETTPVNGGWGD